MMNEMSVCPCIRADLKEEHPDGAFLNADAHCWKCGKLAADHPGDFS